MTYFSYDSIVHFDITKLKVSIIYSWQTNNVVSESADSWKCEATRYKQSSRIKQRDSENEMMIIMINIYIALFFEVTKRC